MTTKENTRKIINNLGELLEYNNVTQSELAKDLNVSRGQIHNIIKGRVYPSINLAFDIAEFFGKELHEVFWREKSK